MRLNFLGSVVVLGIFLAGCGATDVDAPRAESPAELNELLAGAGLECANFEDDATIETPTTSADDLFPPLPDFDQTEPGTDASGSCELDGEDVDLLIFKDEGQRDNYIAGIRVLGCAVGGEGSSTPQVIGDRWIIQPDTETLADEIADALGANSDTIEC